MGFACARLGGSLALPTVGWLEMVFKHGWPEAFQYPFLDVRKMQDLVPELVSVDHGHGTECLQVPSHGAFAGPDAANHSHHGYDSWL